MKALMFLPLLLVLAAGAHADRKGNSWPVLPDVPPVKDSGCTIRGVTTCSWEECSVTGDMIWVCTTETETSQDCVPDDG